MEILECGHVESEHSSTTRGYGTMPDGSRHCYECCAKMDREYMIEHGKMMLYFCESSKEVSNWPGSLKFKLYPRIAKSWHNFGRQRNDFWFNGPDGHVWHGYQIGDYNQIAHCKRTNKTTL